MDYEACELGLEDSRIPASYRWPTLLVSSVGTEPTSEQQLMHYEEILDALSTGSEVNKFVKNIFAKAQNKIDKAVYLSKLIDMINAEQWFFLNNEPLGLASWRIASGSTHRARTSPLRSLSLRYSFRAAPTASSYSHISLLFSHHPTVVVSLPDVSSRQTFPTFLGKLALLIHHTHLLYARQMRAHDSRTACLCCL